MTSTITKRSTQTLGGVQGTHNTNTKITVPRFRAVILSLNISAAKNETPTVLPAASTATDCGPTPTTTATTTRTATTMMMMMLLAHTENAAHTLSLAVDHDHHPASGTNAQVDLFAVRLPTPYTALYILLLSSTHTIVQPLSHTHTYGWMARS